MKSFDYRTAFSRNIGWVTEAEQEVLRNSRIAIAGMGGVGGIHLLTLARLGIGKFHISDFDTFDLANFNRQAGATMQTLGLPKTDVMAEQALEINPQLDIRIFPQGVNAENLDDFFKGVDLYVDGLDFFVFKAREIVYEACDRLKIPAVIAAPLGMGVAIVNILPGRMSFEEYFRFSGVSDQEKALRFLLGLSPSMLQLGYLVDRSTVDFIAQRGPSTAMACQLCAGSAATEALKILLKRGKALAAPYGYQFDAYRNKFTRTWRPGGNNNPIQRLALAIARHQLKSV
jgi:molybdopterin/thiamine biosynthesis adenylyltransferase